MRTIISFLLMSSNFAFGQDSTYIFDMSKGTWDCPLQKYSSVQKAKNSISKKDCKTILFTADSSCGVNALFDGLIISLGSVNDIYSVITKFGDYYIIYSGLSKPDLKKGDFIFKGQKVADLLKNDFGKFKLAISIKRGDKYFDPYKWFRNKSSL
mgnify:FL=1